MKIIDGTEQPPEKPNRFLGITLKVTAFLVLVGFLGADTRTPEEKAADIEAREVKFCSSSPISAFVMAKGFVKPLLKSPATADFPTGTKGSVIKSTGECTYVVASWVDAQNSFGANLRTTYVATVKYLGNNQWRLVDVQFS